MSESENINIKTTLSAHDLASPVLNGLLKNLRKIESGVKRFNTAFDVMGKSGAAAMAGINRNAESVVTRMNRVSESVRDASRTYSDQWRRATDQRLRDARHMYREIDKLERDHQRQAERRQAAERRANGQRYGREFGRARMPAPRLRSLAFGGAVAIGGVAGAFKQRMDAEAAEVRTQMFGDLSKAETNALRKKFTDKIGIKYGVGSTKAMDAATEGLKAGIAKEVIGEFAELSLKAQAGLEVDVGDTARLLGRLATQMPWSEGRFSKVLNSIAVANNLTASSGSEIIEGMRRSLSALATTHMTPEQLAAINATGISLGLMPGKTGTFVSFLTSQIAGADSAHGQPAKDLNHAANALGFGGRRGMATAMRDNPMQTINQILENLANMPEALRTRVAKELGGRMWMDELLTLVLGRGKLKEVLKGVESKPGFLDKVALQRIKSLQGRWASITAAMGLVIEKIGGGFESAFDSISDAIINLADRFNFDTIRDHFSGLVDGLRDGFGLKNWGEAVESLASSFDAGTVAKWKAFGKGFAEGLREIVGMLKSAFTGMASLFGSGDAEGMGKFTARLLGLTVALALVAPAVNTLGAISLFLLTLGAVASGAATGIAALFLTLTVGAKFALSWVADKIFDAFRNLVDPIVAVIKSIATKSWDWIKSWFGFGGASPTSGTSDAADFSGSRRRVAALSASPASSIMPDISSVTGGVGTKISTVSSDKFFDLNLGAGLGGSAYLAARRRRFGDEMKNDPALREQVAAMIVTEGVKDPVPVVESLMNRMDMTGGTLKKGLYSGFYGPINRGQLPAAVARVRRDPKLRARMDAAIDSALQGSNTIKGATDQGLPSDPNGRWMGGRIMRGGNVFNDWGGGRFGNLRGHAASKAYREMLQRGVESGGATQAVPSVTANVPPSTSAETSALLQKNGSAILGGSRGPVAIHINGNSHDPEALATLVQRRIDEQMNWRMHDIDYELA